LPRPSPEWVPASALISGERLDGTLDLARPRGGAPLATAAAMVWRSYAHWLASPPGLGWAKARRFPLAVSGGVLLAAAGGHCRAPVTFGWRRAKLAALPQTPATSAADVTIITSEAELLGKLRATLREEHLDPLLAQIQTRVRLGTRTLLGSLASAVAYAVVRG